MKKLMLLSFLLMTATFIHAQRGGGSPEEYAQKRVDHLTEALELTTDQQADLKEIFVAQLENRKAMGKKIREMNQEERDALKAERKAAKEETDAKIAAILTPDQQVAYENLAEERKGKRGTNNKGKGKKAKKGKKGKQAKGTVEERTQRKTERLAEKLGLDEEQQSAVYDLLLQNAPTSRTDFRNLSDEERATLRAEGKEKRAAMDAELAKILTPEQLETYQGMKNNRGRKG